MEGGAVAKWDLEAPQRKKLGENGSSAQDPKEKNMVPHTAVDKSLSYPENGQPQATNRGASVQPPFCSRKDVCDKANAGVA